MSRQDRQGVRTPADLERKYNFEKRFDNAMEAAKAASDSVERLNSALDQTEVFNRLTNNGEAQGFFLDERGNVYLNASYLTTGILRSKDSKTFYLDLVNGILKGQFAELSISGKSVDNIAGEAVDAQTQEDVFNKLTNNGETEGLYIKDGELYINASYLETGILKSADGKTFYLDLKNNALKGDFVHRNLLDNSDFSNPVNQRGLSSYTGSYGIDRWRVWGTGVLTVNSGCISVANDSAFQYLPQSAVKSKMHTLAAKKTNGTLLVHSANPLSAFAWAANGLGLGLDSNVVVGLPVGEYEWAALYEGEYTAESLPNYQPKGYTSELLECQRYYYQSWDTAEGFNDSCPALIAASGWALPPMAYFPVEMRIKPTVTIYSNEGTLNTVRIWDNSASPAVTGANRISRTRFGVGASNTLAVGKLYKFHFSASADL